LFQTAARKRVALLLGMPKTGRRLRFQCSIVELRPSTALRAR
jgi:hypothetical protein